MLRRISLFLSMLSISGAALAHPGHPGRVVDNHIHPEEWLAMAALGVLIVGLAVWGLRQAIAERRKRKP